jgi:hypothetical protein
METQSAFSEARLPSKQTRSAITAFPELHRTTFLMPRMQCCSSACRAAPLQITPLQIPRVESLRRSRIAPLPACTSRETPFPNRHSLLLTWVRPMRRFQGMTYGTAEPLFACPMHLKATIFSNRINDVCAAFASTPRRAKQQHRQEHHLQCVECGTRQQQWFVSVEAMQFRARKQGLPGLSPGFIPRV